MKRSVYFFYYFILGALYVITLRRTMERKKKPEKMNNIYRLLYFIQNIKLKIMLYEPFMLNKVWKSTERFENLSLKKYVILKMKIGTL